MYSSVLNTIDQICRRSHGYASAEDARSEEFQNGETGQDTVQ